MTFPLNRRSIVAGALAATVLPRPLRAAKAIAPSGRAAPRSRFVGMNLSRVAYWTTQFPFADLTKNSSGWSSRDRGGASAGQLALRPDGYPAALAEGQSAVNAVAWSGTAYALGKYVVLWDGKGDLRFPGNEANLTERAQGRTVLEPKNASAALNVAITRTDPADPVRNMRFLWPGTEPRHRTDRFNPVFLDRLAPFAALRFMDWGATNGSSIVRWADRPRPEDCTYATARGVPVEVMLDLANTLQADPWFCVPHQGDDDYVHELATLLRDRLDPALQATIEYSNEVWNSGFAQAAWAKAQSVRLGLPMPNGLASAFYAERVLSIVATFERVYGPGQRHRWLAVVAGQAAWTQFSRDALAWKNTAKRVDALAIAPYFQAARAADPARVHETLALAPDAILQQMLDSIRGEVRSRLAQNAALAGQFALPLVGYEGGAHDTASQFPAEVQEAATAVFAAAHRHPRMREVYREYFETWIAAGGGSLNHYADIGKGSKWGFWSVLEHVTQDPADAPKYRALLEVIAAHPS